MEFASPNLIHVKFKCLVIAYIAFSVSTGKTENFFLKQFRSLYYWRGVYREPKRWTGHFKWLNLEEIIPFWCMWVLHIQISPQFLFCFSLTFEIVFTVLICLACSCKETLFNMDYITLMPYLESVITCTPKWWYILTK